MKKRYVIPGAVTLVIFFTLWQIVPNYIVTMVTDYDPYTFDKVLEDSTMRADYGILNVRHPSDYGFSSTEDVTFFSAKDSLMLTGWYINSAASSDRCILLIHGRTSNRLKTMKYLKIFKETGLDSVYNLFIPDLRNSGQSPASPTAMGYAFAEDIAGSIQFLSNKKSQNYLTLYAFSMGAMASEIMLDRDDLEPYRQGVVIEQMILDSPLANVKRNLKHSAEAMSIPSWVFERAWVKFDKQINNYGSKMNLAYLLHQNDVSTLILAGEKDTTTPIEILREEIKELKRNDFIYKTFPEAGHVRIYQSEQYQSAYNQIIKNFLTIKQ